MSDPTAESSISEAIRSQSNDACVQSLEKNWNAILAAAILEIL